MSRIGKLPISIPANVTVAVSNDNVITVKGPKGELSQKIDSSIAIAIDESIFCESSPLGPFTVITLSLLTATVTFAGILIGNLPILDIAQSSMISRHSRVPHHRSSRQQPPCLSLHLWMSTK